MSVFGKQKTERELDSEIRFHIEQETAANISAGMSPEEARRKALAEFGGMQQAKESVRDTKWFIAMETVLRDIRYATRILRASPAFTIAAILTLGLGIGANTAIFSVVYGVLLRPLPYPNQDRIVQIGAQYKGEAEISSFTAREFHFWKKKIESLELLAAYHGVGFNVTSGQEAVRVRALRVSANYLDVLGVKLYRGRNFSPEEDRRGGPSVVILSYGLWKSQFGGDSAWIGKNIPLDGAAYTVIGILPPNYRNQPAVDLLITIAQADESIGAGSNYTLVGLLKNPQAREQANSEMQTAKTAFFEEFRARVPVEARSMIQFVATPLAKSISFDYRKPLMILLGAIGLVLMIACVNLAGLLSSRLSTRRREIAVRGALGAGRERLASQLLVESLLLVSLGGLAGLFLAYWMLNALLALAPPDVPRLEEIFLDRWALGFTVLASLLSAVLFGLAPAIQASRTNFIKWMKEDGERNAAKGSQKLRNALVVAEVSLSLTLLIGATLLIATFRNLTHTSPGFSTDHLLTIQIWPTGPSFLSSEAMANFDRELLRRVREIPGVQTAAIVMGGLPLERGGNEYFTFPANSSREGLSADYREITPDYFQTLDVPLLSGRSFNELDTRESNQVAIVNRTMMREVFGGQNPIGQRLKMEGQEYEIAGVASDIKSDIGEVTPPTVFLPHTQAHDDVTQAFLAWFPATVLVRTSQEPRSISRNLTDAIRQTNSSVPIGKVQTMEDVLASSVAFKKFLMTLMTAFAALAVGLASVGIYGVMSYYVSQRTHEVGIRMALGARRSTVLSEIVGRGMLLTALGMAGGLAMAIPLTAGLKTQLYGISPLDPAALASAVLVLGIIALMASAIPAWRAASVDPAVALRHE